MKPEPDDFCFACGPKNPHGLHLQGFRIEGEEYVFNWTPEPHVQGWRGIVHGGIITTVLDEAMTRLLWELGMVAVTAEIAVRFLRPLPVGTNTQVTARKTQERGRMVRAEATISDKTGTYARAVALLVRVEDR
jgi:uncharacterized protein (TIGR00369 family)